MEISGEQRNFWRGSSISPWIECKHDKHKTTFRARIKVTPGGHRLRTPRNFAPHQIDNMHWKKNKQTNENRDGNPKSYLTFDNNDIEFLYSRWYLSWKGHIVSVSRKISKSIGITSQVCDYSRPFLTPLLNILCFSKSHNGFSSSGIARGGFQGFRNHRPPPPPPLGYATCFISSKEEEKFRKTSCAISNYTVSLL